MLRLACMVERPGDYRWSSYACYAAGKTNDLIQDHPLYHALGATPEARHEGAFQRRMI